ncbi:MAG: ECF RNA polymerase sigma factor SigW [Planctomycetes bacterium ADurb.Bin401]|nr:MAG: ECF RNA polymerase sigma factor SigW [Planctomycetes bacterium ADurb.Bin401]
MSSQTAKNDKEGFLHRLVSGDSRAFADFVSKYQQEVFLCCRTLGLNNDESEDVASEAFMAAYRGIKKFAGRSKLNTWLWKITYNKAMNCLREKIRRQNLQLKLQSDYIENSSKTTFAENGEFVWNSVRKLPADQALAILLFYRQEKSIKEIADIMQKNQNTVKINLFRGREKLKELLADKVREY